MPLIVPSSTRADTGLKSYCESAISCLDRLRQATAPLTDDSVELHSALAVAAGAFDRIDRRYVLRRIREIERSDLALGRRMRALDSRIRRRVTTAFSQGTKGPVG
jgi:hypothetical protein